MSRLKNHAQQGFQGTRGCAMDIFLPLASSQCVPAHSSDVAGFVSNVALSIFPIGTLIIRRSPSE